MIIVCTDNIELFILHSVWSLWGGSVSWVVKLDICANYVSKHLQDTGMFHQPSCIQETSCLIHMVATFLFASIRCGYVSKSSASQNNLQVAIPKTISPLRDDLRWSKPPVSPAFPWKLKSVLP